MTFHLVILCITCIMAGVKRVGENELRRTRALRLCPATLSIVCDMVKGLRLRIAISLFIFYNTFCYSSSSSSVDARLRRDGVELYNALWGRLTPSCVPPQGVSLCFPLCLRIRRQSAKYDHSFNFTMNTRTNLEFKTIVVGLF